METTIRVIKGYFELFAGICFGLWRLFLADTLPKVCTEKNNQEDKQVKNRLKRTPISWFSLPSLLHPQLRATHLTDPVSSPHYIN